MTNEYKYKVLTIRENDYRGKYGGNVASGGSRREANVLLARDAFIKSRDFNNPEFLLKFISPTEFLATSRSGVRRRYRIVPYDYEV
jgi:hypothetical protein